MRLLSGSTASTVLVEEPNRELKVSQRLPTLREGDGGEGGQGRNGEILQYKRELQGPGIHSSTELTHTDRLQATPRSKTVVRNNPYIFLLYKALQ